MDDTTVISIFMALEGMHAYSAFLPSIMTIGTFVDSKEKVQMIREGEVVATGFLLALSLTVTAITKSPLPMLMGLLAGAVTLGVYEYALRKAPVHEQESKEIEDERFNPAVELYEEIEE